MAVDRYVTTTASPKRITGGPWLWDGQGPWPGPSGTVMLETAAIAGGWSRPAPGAAGATGVLSAEAFGALGNDIADDQDALQAAINASATFGVPLQLAATTYAHSGTLSIPTGAIISGPAPKTGSTPASYIRCTSSGVPNLAFADNCNGQVVLTNLKLNGGSYGLIRPASLVGQISYVYITRCYITGNTAGLYVEGPASEWWMRDSFFHGNNGYGVDFLYDGSQPGALDGFNWRDCRPGGGIGAIRVLSVTSNQWLFERVGGTGGTGHTVVLGGSCTGFMWKNCYFAEDQGGTHEGGNNYDTTGGITAGSDLLTLANATGYTIGTQVTIDGAGAFGAHLVANILSMTGAVATLDVNASTTVSGAATTAAPWDTVNQQVYQGTSPSFHLVENCTFGRGSGSTIRYGWNCEVGGNHTFINHTTYGSPVYDPQMSNTYIGIDKAVRTRASVRFSRLAVGRGDLPWTSIATPRGADLRFGLIDSVGNGTGAFGEFGFWSQESGGTKVASITRDGAIKSRSRTTAQRPSASVVGAGGQVWDSTLGRPIWSNGATWVDATGAPV